MLTKMSSPAFKIQGKERPPIEFKEGLNVVLGKDDGAAIPHLRTQIIAHLLRKPFAGRSCEDADYPVCAGHNGFPPCCLYLSWDISPRIKYTRT